MIADTDKVKGHVLITVQLINPETEAAYAEATKITDVNCSLSEVGTVLQRQAYELLRICADRQTKDKI